MAVIPDNVKELFEGVDNVVFATADETAQPNVNIIGIKKIIDDETIYLSDQFFNKTLANLKANQKVAIVFWDGRQAFQIHGTARYVNEGPEFEEQRMWVDALFEEKGLPIKAKGGAFIHVDAVYESASGPAAGSKIA